MFNYIKGVVVNTTSKSIICENNGIGYEILVANPYNFKINDEYLIFTYLQIKEDGIYLYGFEQQEEKDLFLKLISVNGIGPKSALAILATSNVKEIVDAINNGDTTYLKKFPGIGNKSAMQIVLDLKGKLIQTTNTFDNPKAIDVKDALEALGYNKKEIDKVVNDLDYSLEVGELIKVCLQRVVK